MGAPEEPGIRAAAEAQDRPAPSAGRAGPLREATRAQARHRHLGLVDEGVSEGLFERNRPS